MTPRRSLGEATMSESEILNQVRLALQSVGCTTFRNNTGKLKTEDGRFVNFGLCVGSSDAIGFYEHKVRPKDVGRTVAIFTAIETKGPNGRLTKDQTAFLKRIQSAGGIAGVARSPADALEAIRFWLEPPGVKP